jgi:hypothetical protein
LVKTKAGKHKPPKKLEPHGFAAGFYSTHYSGTSPLEIPGPRDDAATAGGCVFFSIHCASSSQENFSSYYTSISFS